MCQFVMLGAQTEPHRLREIFSKSTHDFDTDVAPDARSLLHFSATCSVLCITFDGCSCALLSEPMGDGPPGGQCHPTPAYAFRRSLAEVALRFGSVQLLKRWGPRAEAQAEPITRRTTTLGQFLRRERIENNSLLHIIA